MPVNFLTNAGNSYGNAVPFQRTIEPGQLGLFLNLEQAELIRLQRYNEAWRFYHGKHWSFKREEGEPLVTLNYFRKFIDKHVEFLVSKGFHVGVPDCLENITKPLLDEVWKYNNRERLTFDIATSGSVTGDIFVMVTEEAPTEMQRQLYPFSQGKIRINLLGSEQVFPVWDPLNHECLTSVRIETIYYADRGSKQLDRSDRAGHDGRTLYTKRFTQTITPTSIVEQYQGEMPTYRVNVLGEIPLVHIQNLSVPKEYYGMSDGQDLIDLQRELNEKSTDISDVIHYHSAPVTIITGAKMKKVNRGPNAVWSGLPEGANVFNLKLEGDLTTAKGYWDQIKKTMHELGDIPEGILGQMQPISNTSGVALHQQYGPIMGRRRRKLATYGPGFEMINYLILRVAQVTGRIALPYDLCAECGGRIIEVDTGDTDYLWNEEAQDYIEVPRRKKMCFHINRHSLDFEKPEDMKVKIWRDYSFGGEIREVTLSEAEAIAAGKTSYWDYAYEELEAVRKYEEDVQRVNAENEKLALQQPQQPEVDPETGEVLPSKPKAQMVPRPQRPIPRVKKLPMGEVEVPEEPITITLERPLIHPRTQAIIRVVSQNRTIVPTGCKKPRYLSPFENTVTFTDVLPKDESLQADLYQRYQNAGWVDVEWVQNRIPDIAIDMAEINRRIKAHRTSGLPNQYSSAMVPGAPQAPAITDLTPAEQPAASVPGPGGNPVSPGSEGAA